MTEAEWRACRSFGRMFRRAEGLIPPRKRLRWWVACCRHRWAALTDRQRRAVEAVDALLEDPEYGTQEEERGPNEFLTAVSSVLGLPGRQAARTALLREIVGYPFRPVECSPHWRTDTVLALARQMYESRDFTAMPILADALQDAGCEDATILDHCRRGGEHVRGCWVADLVLGRG